MLYFLNLINVPADTAQRPRSFESSATRFLRILYIAEYVVSFEGIRNLITLLFCKRGIAV
jgi:hypothetical protein